MKSTVTGIALTAALALTAAAAIGAQTTPSYLAQFPSAARIRADVRGVDDMETAAKQASIFWQLRELVYSLALTQHRTERQFTPDERRMRGEYYAARYEAIAPYGEPNAKNPKWLRVSMRFQSDPVLRDEVFKKYFTPKLRTAVYAALREMPSGTRAGSTLGPSVSAPGANDLGFAQSFGGPQGPGIMQRITGTLMRILQLGGMAVVVGVFAVGIILWLRYQFKNSRRFLVRRNNKGALEVFGSDRAAREHAILDAFDSTDYTFRYDGDTRERQFSLMQTAAVILVPVFVITAHWYLALFALFMAWFFGPGSANRMRFVLLRNVRSFRRGDLESLRFAYVAFNRGDIDDEKFHWYRFSAISGGGKTDPAEWSFGGWFKFMRSKRGDIEKARERLKAYAAQNVGEDIESQALATIQTLVAKNPADSLYADLRRRFVEGAYWLTKSELKRSAFAPADTPYNITLGVLDGSDTELIYAGEGSIITIAPPGSGKTQCNVLPNLLRWPGPAVVLDVKGEIYEKTSAWRAANVGPVIKFSPLDPERSAKFNPLTGIRRESFFLWEDARFLADMMIVPKAKEAFWEDKAKEVLTAIIADVAFWNRPADRTMSKVLSLVNRSGWTEFIDRLRKNPELQTMRDEGANLAQMDPRTLDGALQTAKANLGAWVGERIALATQRSDWSPLDLRAGTNPTIYVCVKPNEIEAYLSLLRVVIAQHIRTLCAELPPRDAAPILFVLDELPRLRQMPPVEEALEVGRQYGIRLWMFAQNVGQMTTAYPNGDSMMGSCAVRTFMNPSLQDGTAKLVAEQIGFRSGEEHGGKDHGGMDPVSHAEKLVVTPTQLAGADFKEMQIVFGVGSKPARVRKMFAHKDPTLVARMGSVPEQRVASSAALPQPSTQQPLGLH